MTIPTPFTEKTNEPGNGSDYLIRPIQTNDRERIIALFNHLSPENRYLRFAHAITKLPDDFLDDILHLDYKKEMALVAVIQAHTDVVSLGNQLYLSCSYSSFMCGLITSSNLAADSAR